MALAYLLSPTFEIVNSAGKPATGGYIETYVAGSRTKYLCASDFEGTRHPFRIPLDSLGSNVVLADDSGSYDVYVYNRYGTLLMSRYNVHPGEGGGLGGGTITSSDGSIIVTPTANGNDLKVNVGEPSVLRAGADTIYSSGPFVFSELVREGDKVWVDNSGKIRCRVGWYHYDITVRITWAPESPRNETIPVQLYTTLASNLTDFDASYTHDNTIRLSGETKIVENGAELAFGVLGLRNGLGAELIDMGVHAICIGTAGQSDLSAGTGIVIDQGEISVDPMYMSGYVTQPELTYGLAGKQDVISDLSTIRSGAAAGSTAVQPSDLATVATTGDYDDLNDKPDLSVYATTSAMNTALAGKQDTISDLAQIRSGAAAGASAVQPADLARVATTGDYGDLNNRPNLTVYATKTEVTDGLATKQDVISDLSTIRSGAAAGATALQPADVATVATTGDYDDLIDKPDLSVYATTQDLTTGLASKQDTISDLATIRSGAAEGATAVQPGDLATVATSGSYNDLSDKPSIPAAQVNSDWNASSGVSEILNKPQLSTVATTGDYDDLVNKPSIPAAQVNSDWNAVSGVSEILNKPALATVATSGSYTDLSNTPSIPTATSDLTNDSGFITSSDIPVTGVEVDGTSVVNANGVAEITMPTIPVTDVEVDGASVVNASGVAEITLPTFTQAQADWTEADTTDPSYIQNKPNLATVATTGAYSDLTGTPTIPAAQVNSDWNASSGVAEILNKPSLAAVATSGSYTDLTDKPSIPAAQVNADWNSSSGVSEILNKPTLATVATTGAYSDLSGTPTIPTATSDLTNDSGFITLSDVPAQAQADWTEADSSDPSYIQNKPTLAAVATSGSYSDLSGTPTLATVATSGDYADLTNKPSIPAAQVQSDWTQSDSNSVDYIKNKPNLATVATSGSYTDLSNTPTIPAAPVQSDWTEADSSSLAYIANKPNLATVATTGAYSDLSGTPTINNVPAVTSSDDSKVLKASYSGGVGSYSWEAESVAVTDVEVNGSSVVSGGVASITIPAQVNADWNSSSGASEILNKPTIPSGTQLVPAATSADADKVLKVNSQGTPEWATGGGSQVQADWAESDSSEPSYIENKPVPKTLTAGTGISITENQSTITIANTVTPPTVDQTYDASSTNAQSGTAVADAIGNLGTNLSAAQLLALKEALGCDETVLYEDSTGSGTVQLSEDPNRFERLGITYHCWNDNTGEQYVEVPANQTLYTFGGDYVPASGNIAHFYTRLSYSTPTLTCVRHCYVNNGNPSTVSDGTSTFKFYKVVGIHRVASN